MSYQEERGRHRIARLAPLQRRASWHAQSSLPAPLTSFVGRDQEIAALTARLAETRLLTLTGVGGIGKSRLALEVGRAALGEAAEEIPLVELAAVSEPAHVVAVVASTLGVRDSGERPLADALATALTGRDLVLLLDNCEQVAEATADLALALLQACPELRLLVTSRIPLGLTGESVWRLEPLAVPDPEQQQTLDSLISAPSVRLFVDRASAARSTFKLSEENARDVVRICRHLDGIPLAIELAAARVTVLSPRQIVERLGDRFRLLAGGGRTALPRHRTLHALIDWSHDLLEAPERILFRRLAVFAGGWTVEAAETVCSDDPSASSGHAIDRDEVLDLLGRLVAKSLVTADHAGHEPRLRLLETIRAYALDRLQAAGEQEQVRQRHLNWIMAMAAQAEVQLWTAEQRVWLEHLDAELDNVRAALAWSTGPGDAEAGLRIAGSLWRYWEQRGHAGEARRWLSALLERPSTGPSTARAMALEVSCYFAHLTGDLEAAQTHSEAACRMARDVGDPVALICSLLSEGILSGTAGDLAASQATFQEALALARQAGWEPGVRMALLNLGVLARIGGAEGRAAALFEEGHALSQAAGDSYTQGFYLTNLAHLSLQQGDGDAAADRYRQALGIWRDLQDTHNVAVALEGLAWAVGAQGQSEQSVQMFGAAEALRERVGTALFPHWQTDHDRARAAAQAALGERAFAEAWAQGRAMTVEQAIAYGLARHDDGRSEAGRASGTRDRAARPLLSSREVQVARLVTRGLTNRQIAETLVLQESTVGNHLQRIYARLGLRGRAQLATWISEHDRTGAPPP